MKKPNFFILGAPKCGTTALFHYLAGHPNVFVPAVKEPYFFASDITFRHARYQDERAYRSLFEGATDGHLAVGEASVWYLFSDVAAERIREFDSDARVIVMLRNPVDMFRSLHNQMITNLWEDELDPERAWRLQPERRRGAHVSGLCDDPRLLLYGQTCALGAQVDRLLTVFPADQVRMILYDDLVSDPREMYEGTLRFLGLPEEGRSDFPLVNVAHAPRSLKLARLHQRIDRAIASRPVLRPAQALLAPLRPASRSIRRLNDRPTRKRQISARFREELRDFFEADVNRLAAVVGRDLSHWKATDDLESPHGSIP